jgi:hypothetical protein
MVIKVIPLTEGQAEIISRLNKKVGRHIVPCSHGGMIYIESRYLAYPYFWEHKKYLEPYGLVEIEIEID